MVSVVPWGDVTRSLTGRNPSTFPESLNLTALAFLRFRLAAPTLTETLPVFVESNAVSGVSSTVSFVFFGSELFNSKTVIVTSPALVDSSFNDGAAGLIQEVTPLFVMIPPAEVGLG